ncbi:hypothetical protein C1645_865972 [Glomus cerebriforme]|uniref:Uncharacterized protein n=1 Tax=Glomus cerebriforme TaxID=658196 RepID=A0A397TCY3_9GLOM|nr:hypothetical protein C1645_865972 [Glomus cerebriforme]
MKSFLIITLLLVIVVKVIALPNHLPLYDNNENQIKRGSQQFELISHHEFQVNKNDNSKRDNLFDIISHHENRNKRTNKRDNPKIEDNRYNVVKKRENRFEKLYNSKRGEQFKDSRFRTVILKE